MIIEYPNRTVLLSMAILHLAIITASNYLVQIPIMFCGHFSTWGTLSFPLVFVATDLTVRVAGAPLARKIVWLAMVPALLSSYLVSVLFKDGGYQGLEALFSLDIAVARIAIASFAAYTTGQLLDIVLFNHLRRLQSWWFAPLVATLFGNVIDTAAFFSIAFYQTQDQFMANHWVEVGLIDLMVKVIFEVLFLIPCYGLLLKAIFAKQASAV